MCHSVSNNCHSPRVDNPGRNIVSPEGQRTAGRSGNPSFDPYGPDRVTPQGGRMDLDEMLARVNKNATKKTGLFDTSNVADTKKIAKPNSVDGASAAGGASGMGGQIGQMLMGLVKQLLPMIMGMLGGI